MILLFKAIRTIKRRRTRTLVCALLLMVFLIISCQKTTPRVDSKLAALVPNQTFAPNWRQDGPPQQYSPDNLFEYINGQAELYLDYEFKELYTVHFMYRGREDETLTVDVYDLGTSLNAWGLYSILRRPGYRFQQIGEAEAVVATYLVRFAKDTKLVQVSTPTKAEHIRKDMVKMATLIAEKIPTSAPLKELSLLPTKGQIEHTIKYLVKGYLGQTFLPPVLDASYEGTNDRFGGFVIAFTSPDSAASGLTQFREFVESRGEVKEELSSLGSGGFWAHLQYHGNLVVTQHSKYIVGAHHADDQKEGEELLDEIINTLKNLQ